MAPHALVGQPRGAAISSIVLYTMGGPGTFHAATALCEMAVAYGPRYCQDTAKMVQDDSKSMSQHRERDRDRLLHRDHSTVFKAYGVIT
jgi:hypothetical protein